MKKLFAIAVFILLAVSVSAQDGRSIYNKFSDEPGVSAVYISPSMFKLIGKIPAIDLGDGGEKVDITLSSSPSADSTCSAVTTNHWRPR